ncbi:hypothetical protein PMAYCL1PPCAC_22236, partial [Pristionchus mayeri]
YLRLLRARLQHRLRHAAHEMRVRLHGRSLAVSGRQQQPDRRLALFAVRYVKTAGLRFPFNDIVAVTSFLVVAVGTDDMLLMMDAVRRRTSNTLSCGRRMAKCMTEVDVSLLITALTDAFSFGVDA